MQINVQLGHLDKLAAHVMEDVMETCMQVNVTLSYIRGEKDGGRVQPL